ncbi:hypothetical protein CDL15_Pgr021973 [Punica granatum]|uniref:Uncharacterized protein n=1 Tax=Punica granatum TaxID=22663 RepID=A0A218WXY9_PUNGR|nr:hypothetical protein CDL15_Pgr021973 [Punica granatum]
MRVRHASPGRWTLLSRAIQKYACGPRRESTFGSVQLGDSTGDLINGFGLDSAESSDNSADYKIFPQRRIALHTGSFGQIQQLHSWTGFYESGKFDACAALVLFKSFTSRSIPLTRSELSQLPQRTWRSSNRKDSHLFVGIARHRFCGHRRQTFQRQRASPKE